MKGISSKQLKRLGELIEILGHDGLDISFHKYNQPAGEIDTRMAKVPKRFHVHLKHSTGGDIRWKHGSVDKLYGFETVEITMFYSKETKGGEKINESKH